MKKALKAMLAAIMAMSLVACSGSSESTSSTTSTDDTATVATTGSVDELLGETPLNPADEYFGILLPLTSSEYYKGVEKELSAYCEQFGIKYEIASADSDTSKQLSQFENFITMGCTTIILYANDVLAMQDVSKKAISEGIRVVSATNTPDDLDSYDIAVDASQDTVGTAAAQYAADWIDEHYPDAEDGSIEVAIFSMSLNENIIERCDGLRKIEELNPKAKIVVDYDISATNYTVEVKEDADLMMQTYPNVKVILTYSDIFNIIIDEAMMADPDIDPSGICSVAVDKTEAIMEKIQLSKTNESTVRATVASGENFSLTIIQAALGKFDNELNEQKRYFVDAFIVDADNVDDYQ